MYVADDLNMRSIIWQVYKHNKESAINAAKCVQAHTQRNTLACDTVGLAYRRSSRTLLVW